MGTEVHVMLDAPRSARAERVLSSAEAEFERLEQTMSRFRPGSELSRLNREGYLARASSDLTHVLELALEARVATGGLFDPTVHDAVVGAGYDRTFEDLVEQAGETVRARCGGVVRIRGRRVVLAPGTRLDFGGIAKGFAVDRVCELVACSGPCVVNAGGDLCTRGGSWPVAITDELTVALDDGAMATSGTDRRRWRRGGREQHHLIDPRTGLPAETGLLRVTVVAATAVEAEVLAKAAFLGAEVDVPRALVLADGRVLLAGGLS
jgi:thiamine biosynthesis lipoprotein